MASESDRAEDIIVIGEKHPLPIGECTPRFALTRRHDNKMDAVRHQTVAPDFDAGFVGRLGEKVAIERIIAVLDEGLLAAIPAVRHVIGVTRAGRGDEGGSLGRNRLFCGFSKLAP
jgi:hypothetical protein